jgi:putative secretion ATPase (PEP-CTERM system associated)
MYTDFFELTDKPFELLPNPRFLYLSKGHKKALSYLRYSIQDRVGFTLLTGEVGSGKTTLLRNTIKEVDAGTPLAMIFNTCVDAVQLLAMVNEEFGLDIAGKGKVALLSELNDFLVTQSGAGQLPILIIDEAQNLSPEALEEVRLLSNLEADCFRLLQIILVGQPELKDVISQPCLRQLRQRISIACHLGPLGRDETEDYIYHRLDTAGKRDAVVFADGTFDRIHDFSGGVPRLINVICDFLLLAAFVDETRNIGIELVLEAVKELSVESTPETGIAAPQTQIQAVTRAHSRLEGRLDRMEEQYARLHSLRPERLALQERVTSHGRLLEYLINIQQSQFREVGEHLRTITGKVEKILPGFESSVVSFDARKKR